jgi:hypothetical protein
MYDFFVVASLASPAPTMRRMQAQEGEADG